ncbi:hypothetical protein GGU11DRAFT_778822 [Lentinula aff. detonsa]|nr:hypothetical protein GGU11DRAFT_778822 [Lentinula aff. detonsa]
MLSLQIKAAIRFFVLSQAQALTPKGRDPFHSSPVYSRTMAYIRLYRTEHVRENGLTLNNASELHRAPGLDWCFRKERVQAQESSRPIETANSLNACEKVCDCKYHSDAMHVVALCSS